MRAVHRDRGIEFLAEQADQPLLGSAPGRRLYNQAYRGSRQRIGAD
jgi:hypothetical protein